MAQQEGPRLTADEAWVYEEFFVPALFGQWASTVVDAAAVQPGDRVLDVACGTGVLARAVLGKVAPAGSVVGLDPNEAMLAVAAQKSREIEWRQGVAESIPFADKSFDAVVSQFGLMFFWDPRGAIREMMRVLRPGGCVAVAVWDALDHTPAYTAFVGLLQRLFGSSEADKLRAPFVLGDAKVLLSLFADAGVASPTLTTCDGTARFPTVRDWVHADAKGWLQLDEDQYRTLLSEAEHALKAFVTTEGRVAFTMPAHIVTAVKT